MQDAHEVAQRQPVVGHHALDLVELRQVCRVQSLVPEDSVDGEILDGGELLLAGREASWLTSEAASCLMVTWFRLKPIRATDMS